MGTKRGMWPDVHANDGFTCNYELDKDMAEATRRRRKQRKKVDKDAWYNTPEFRALRNKWYAKLAKSGFKDIETPMAASGDVFDLLRVKDATAYIMSTNSPTELFAKQEYYYLMDKYVQRLSEHPKKNKEIIDVMRAHADGKSKTHIAKSTGLAWARVSRIIKEHSKLALTEVRSVDKETE